MRFRWRSEAGVAMATVMLVGAGLTAVSSVAAFSAIRELRAGGDDRRATEALAYAEAGVDRYIQYIRSNAITFAQLREAGCEAPPLTLPPVSVGNGEVTTSLTVYDPEGATRADKFPPTACSADRPLTPHDPSFFVITATGSHPAAKRVVQQVIAIEAIGLPIGISANYIDLSGGPQAVQVTMFAKGDVVGRDKIDFTGFDPYYTLEDLWPDTTWGSGLNGTDPVKAALHSTGRIFLKSNGTDPEFPHPATGTKNCDANKTGGNRQSLWDGDGSSGSGPVDSGCTGETGWPPTSRFTIDDFDRVAPRRLTQQDYDNLKAAAQQGGIYCSIGATASCTLLGGSVGYAANWQDGDIAPVFAAGVNHFVAYFDFTSGTVSSNTVRWKADVKNPNGMICDLANPDTNRSVVIVVRRGGVNLENGAEVNGAMFLDGTFKYTGTVTFNGTIIADEFRTSGNATFMMDDCWVQNMPGPFLGVSPIHWSEVDR